RRARLQRRLQAGRGAGRGDPDPGQAHQREGHGDLRSHGAEHDQSQRHRPPGEPVRPAGLVGRAGLPPGERRPRDAGRQPRHRGGAPEARPRRALSQAAGVSLCYTGHPKSWPYPEAHSGAKMRLPAVTRDALTPDEQAIWDRIDAVRPGFRGPYGVLIHVPVLAERVAALEDYFRFDAALPAADRELVVLAVVREAGARYAWVRHEAAG